MKRPRTNNPLQRMALRAIAELVRQPNKTQTKERPIMRPMNKVLTVAVVTAAVAIAAFAAERQHTEHERMLRVLSEGKVVAEIRLVDPALFVCGGSLRVTQEGCATYSTKEPALKATLLFHDKKVVLDLSGNVQFSGQLEDFGLQHQHSKVEH